MQTIAIISKPQKPELAVILPELVKWFQTHGYRPLLDPISASYVAAKDSVPRHDMPGLSPALVVVLGGDGTLLAAARVFSHTETPILSVNLGSLGFLTEVPLSHLYLTLEEWNTQACSMDERAMLYAEVRRDGVMHHKFHALNDVVIAKGTIARMGNFVIELDESAVASFRADGVIVATPTGSTAYNLAANGPILAPDVDGMVVTAVCPHLLTIRPLVVRGDAHITISIEGVPEQLYLTVDGQEAIEMRLGDALHCWRSEHKIRLVRMKNSHNFFDVLRAKLKWGER